MTQVATLFGGSSSAIIDPSGDFRFQLTRIWDPALPHACWIGLNPSDADARRNDPTIRKMIGFARLWGCGGIHVVNLFAIRSPYPMYIDPFSEPTAENDRYILDSVQGCEIVVACWGAEKVAIERAAQVLANLKREGVKEIKCLGTTKGGQPRHPLYLSYDLRLVDFAWQGAV